MKILEPGHVYAVENVDGPGKQEIRFVRRRDGKGEPLPESTPGVLTQELLRVCIDRTLYLYAEAPCDEDTEIIEKLRDCLVLYESRAARRAIERLPKPEQADCVLDVRSPALHPSPGARSWLRTTRRVRMRWSMSCTWKALALGHSEQGARRIARAGARLAASNPQPPDGLPVWTVEHHEDHAAHPHAQGGEGPGIKPPQRGLFRREVIGPPECPILIRWTVANLRFTKLLVHRFLPNADDRDVHDHPRAFVTVVLRGGYDDLVPCSHCDGTGMVSYPDMRISCGTCGDVREAPPGLVVGDRMCRGTIRYRPAEHRHRTRVGPNGCWTLVAMGPLVRAWGFWKDGRWLDWQAHERRYGFGMRCGDEQDG
ncbi:MAG: hypothetical protein LC798_12825 [Chloroflexi bacterium]|nr:hypothetical protein [Chloroflexota bacterium]